MNNVKNNLWQRWEEEVRKFKFIKKENRPPAEIISYWRRHLQFIFMQELSKNILDENETFDSILERIIEAIQIGCGFEYVRVYRVDEKKGNELHLYQKSKEHEPIKKKLRLAIKKGIDNAVETLFTRKPLLLDDAQKAKLVFREYLHLEGPYVAIPLLVENEPFGLICASKSSSIKPGENILKYPEYFEQIDTFARNIMAAIENRKIFEQRNQKMTQLELIDKIAKLIQSETEKDKLLKALVRYSVNLVKATGGHLKLKDEKTGKLKHAASFGIYVAPPEMRNKSKALKFSNFVMKGKNTLLINNLQDHLIMKRNKEFCIKNIEEKVYDNYLKILENRKSALMVPLKTHTGEIIGVLDLHSDEKDHFKESDKENLEALLNSVIYAVDKTRQLELRDEFLTMHDELLSMLKDAIGVAHCYECVLDIIKRYCQKLLRGKGLTICLMIKNPYTNELSEPPIKCYKSKLKEKDCDSCIKNNPIIKKAFSEGKDQSGEKERAIPIFLKGSILGVLYLQSSRKVVLTDNEKQILAIITSTAAFLIKTARKYEEKIKQSTALHEVGQPATEAHSFRGWFNLLMEKVLDIIGRENRNFHLVMVEGEGDKKKLIIRATSPLFINGKKDSMKAGLVGLELPIDGSLAGEVVKTEKSQIIHDVETNKKRKVHKYYEYDPRIKSEVGIPLKIKEGGAEKIIGVLIIDSVISKGFQEFDLPFHETIANYLAIAIRTQQLYEEREKFQEEIYRIDRSLALKTYMRSFFHEVTPPVQEIRSQINIMRLDGEAKWKENLDQLEYLSDKLLSGYNKFERDFRGPDLYEPVKIGIREIIVSSLDTVERIRGLDIPVGSNFENSDIEIECYPVYVGMAFRSIINNAIRYSRGLVSRKRYLKINVSTIKNDMVKISFESSTTEKIPSDKLKMIFKPFVRLSSKEPGQGLGLSLAAECVNMHNGDIWAENVEGKKAVRFNITLPKILKIKEEYQNGYKEQKTAIL